MKNPTQIISHLPTPLPNQVWSVDYLGTGLEKVAGEHSEWYLMKLYPTKYTEKFYIPRAHQHPSHREAIFFEYAQRILKKLDPLTYPNTQQSSLIFYKKYSRFQK